MAEITTKIDKAIYDAELHLRDARDRRILICKEIEMLEKQVDTLRIIKKDETLT